MKSPGSFSYPPFKRILDLVGAGLLLFLLLPLLALLAVCIWWDAGSPILFVQERVGHSGERFRMYKLRTLESEPKDPTRPAEQTTRTGSVLRRWGLDELPQLWNVLRGDMSLVGPRPALPAQVERYGSHASIRLQVRPGLTGWAQIQGRNALSWPERIHRDVWYVNNYCLSTDLFILLKTPIVLIRGVGTYGPDGRNPSFPSSCHSS